MLQSSEDAIEIFVSYACDDNVVPPGLKSGKGFVSALVEQLDYVFKRQGPPKIRLWWDERQLDRLTRIDSAIDEGIKKSALLLVVMSRNWLSRPWCQQELKLFSQQKDYDQRIALVRANYVEQVAHPPELQNIRGFDFFSLDNWRQAGNERLFFDLGEPKDGLFYDYVNELGGLIWSRAKTIRDKTAPASGPAVEKQRNGRTVYLAKSAPDTAGFYRRVANELEREGYTVVPPVTENIPEDSATSALQFIDDALSAAEVCIHLLGEKKGSKPDEELDYIVPLQLQRAAERINSSGASAAQFQRIIWAPKSPEEDCKFSANGFREPVDVVAKFTTRLASDQLYGDVSSAFLTNVKRDLERRRKQPEAIGAAVSDGTSSRIYIWHREDDLDFARKIRRWLQQNNVETMLPGRDNDPDRDKLHRMNLAECDVVFLCWAHASDVWAKMSARELRSWRDLGRKQQFSLRSLVLGPPPEDTKTEDDLPSIPHEIDSFVDLSNDQQLALDRLKPLLERARSRHPQ
jgi:TIR domain